MCLIEVDYAVSVSVEEDIHISPFVHTEHTVPFGKCEGTRCLIYCEIVGIGEIFIVRIVVKKECGICFIHSAVLHTVEGLHIRGQTLFAIHP